MKRGKKNTYFRGKYNPKWREEYWIAKECEYHYQRHWWQDTRDRRKRHWWCHHENELYRLESGQGEKKRYDHRWGWNTYQRNRRRAANSPCCGSRGIERRKEENTSTAITTSWASYKGVRMKESWLVNEREEGEYTAWGDSCYHSEWQE